MISRPVGPPFPRRVQYAASNPPRIGIIKPVTLSPPRKGGRLDGVRADFADDDSTACGARARLAGLFGACRVVVHRAGACALRPAVLARSRLPVERRLHRTRLAALG